MRWPSPSEYHEAVQNPPRCFLDPELQAGSIATDALGLPRVASGNFASVYDVSAHGRRWAVRCFLRPVTDQQERYREVSRHLEGLELPALVGFVYQPEGLRLPDQTVPLVKMEWVEGETLPTFIARNLDAPETLRTLAARWRGMVNSLRGNRLAHGDLQHGNVLVTPGGQLRLVDYDAMFVPGLRGRLSLELGHVHYQHPQRSAAEYDETLDNFSALVIYLSLRAVAAEPSLWATFYSGENLLFVAADYRRPSMSALIARLAHSPDPVVVALAAELASCCSGPISAVPEFETAVTHAIHGNAMTVTPPEASAPPSGMPVGQGRAQQAAPLQAFPIEGPFTTPSYLDRLPSEPLTPTPSPLDALPSEPLIAPPQTPYRSTTPPSSSLLSPVASGPIRRNPIDGAERVEIAAGEFLMGNDDGPEEERPQRGIALDAYEIDRTPVTVAQYRRFCRETHRNLPPPPPWGMHDDYPMVNVSWHDAQAYAAWARGRLPTEAEWEKAARGTDGRAYPWGNAWDPTRCVHSVGRHRDGPEAVGHYLQGTSPYGILDMAGNVWEWCADRYDESAYVQAPAVNPTGPSVGEERVLRGGSWEDDAPSSFRASSRGHMPSDFRHFGLGFRCTSEPFPGKSE
ncbi:MAG TPA: SUMF1/EgtB/PvdO family nonheme iron enzyme [Chthonomonadaceae bacterium]|nr:SUMF1/EgtB/PvdO family nonheme iron enzyme [Chthonomonadaceae bacterium]